MEEPAQAYTDKPLQTISLACWVWYLDCRSVLAVEHSVSAHTVDPLACRLGEHELSLPVAVDACCQVLRTRPSAAAFCTQSASIHLLMTLTIHLHSSMIADRGSTHALVTSTFMGRKEI
jgi:hypothetical protein